MASLTISGIDHVLRILNQYPQLSGLSSLAPIYRVGHLAAQAVKKTGCGCSASPVYSANQNLIQQSLATIGNGDHIIIKSVLGIDKLCFYAKDSTGKNTLRCV
jgi:hypothetical protein